LGSAYVSFLDKEAHGIFLLYVLDLKYKLDVGKGGKGQGRAGNMDSRWGGLSHNTIKIARKCKLLISVLGAHVH
jgi:hypothetical protein